MTVRGRARASAHRERRAWLLVCSDLRRIAAAQRGRSPTCEWRARLCVLSPAASIARAADIAASLGEQQCGGVMRSSAASFRAAPQPVYLQHPLRRCHVPRARCVLANAAGGGYNVVITGSTKGLGLALARKHLEEGVLKSPPPALHVEGSACIQLYTRRRTVPCCASTAYLRHGRVQSHGACKFERRVLRVLRILIVRDATCLSWSSAIC